MTDFRARRESMVERQIAGRGIDDERLLAALRQVPRERFVPERLREFAYEDSPLPIAAGQTISQPFIVAAMIDALDLEPEDTVLEVGVGSGYAAAVMSRMCKAVYGVERHAELAESAAARCRELGYDNVHVRHGDGTLGWPERAPFDAESVAAAGPDVPQPLLDQLAVGGRLVIPVGSQRAQELVRIVRRGEDDYERQELGGVRFVPLIGAAGWTAEGEEAAAGGVIAPPAQHATPERTVAALVHECSHPFTDLADAKHVRPAHEDCYERVCHDTGLPAFVLPLREPERDELRDELMEPRLERAIGVVYRPETELASHYFQAVLPRQFDAWVWFDESRAVEALPPASREPGVPDTWPFGL